MSEHTGGKTRVVCPPECPCISSGGMFTDVEYVNEAGAQTEKPVLVVWDAVDGDAAMEGGRIPRNTSGYALWAKALKAFSSPKTINRLAYVHAIRCVPMGKTTPAKVFNACREHFWQDVEDLRPEYVIVLGNDALRIATKKAGISSKCNQVIEAKTPSGVKYKVLPILSPRFVLRDNNQHDRFMSAAKFALDTVEGRTAAEVLDGFRPVIHTLQQTQSIQAEQHVLRRISAMHYRVAGKKGKYVAFDVETNSLNPYTTKNFRLLSIAVADAEDCICLGIDYPGVSDDDVDISACKFPLQNFVVLDSLFRKLLTTPDVAKVGHNVKFDMHCIRSRFGVTLDGVIDDTLILHKHLHAVTGGHDLKTLAAGYLGVGDYSAALTKWVGENGDGKFAEIPEDILLLYNSKDAVVTHKLYKLLRSELVETTKKEAKVGAIKMKNAPLSRMYLSSGAYMKVIYPSIMDTFAIECKGVPFDMQYALALDIELEQAQKEAMDKCLADKKVQQWELYEQTEKGSSKARKFNPSSPKIVGEVLFTFYNAPVIEKTPTGNPSVSADVLQTLISQEHPCSALCAALLTYTRLVKRRSTYVTSFLEYADTEDKRIHCTFNPLGTVTGRLSSRDPNLQNLPREAKYRSLIAVQEKDRILVAADYSQIELRLLAAYSRDSNMLQVYREERDLHLETAVDVFQKPKKDITSEERTAAKSVNFGVVYGITADGLAVQLTDILQRPVEREEAETYRQRFYRAYPNVKRWQRDVCQFVTQHGYVPTAFGNVRPLANAKIKSKDFTEKRLREEALRRAVNTPIQGTAGLLTSVAISSLRRAFAAGTDLYGEDTEVVMTVHDEILVETDTRYLRNVLKRMREAMVREPMQDNVMSELFGRVPLVVDFKFGRSFGKMTELKWKGK